METSNCPHCVHRREKELEAEEFSFAILLALLPLVVMTFFSQVGLI